MRPRQPALPGRDLGLGPVRQAAPGGQLVPYGDARCGRREALSRGGGRMIKRGRFQNVFDLAQEVGPWDERPVAPPFADPQAYMSRGSGPQPIFLICEKNTVVMQIVRTAGVELRYTRVRHTPL